MHRSHVEMPQKLDWAERYLFVWTNHYLRIKGFVEHIALYERALARCVTAKTATTVLGRELTKSEITSRLTSYGRMNGLTYKAVCKKTSGFKHWPEFARQGLPLEPLTILFCSPDIALRVFLKSPGKGKMHTHLTQAVSEVMPYVAHVPWIDSDVCIFGRDVWKIDASERALELSDLKLLLLDRIDRERQKFESLRRKFAGEAGRRVDPLRKPIPESVRMYVWRRDEGKCVVCGSQERLEFDHIIPFSKGGGSTDRNIQLLCEQCNRSKKDRI
jgi:5-methylcytosine-specific restriction endonuclease McrA